MESYIVNLLSSVTFAVLAFALGWLAKKYKDQQSLGHLRNFIGNSSLVKIVIAQAVIPKFTIDSDNGGEAVIPTNQPVIPVPEGQAIAEIVQAIRNSARQNIRILVMPATDFHDDGTPFIAIGGPSTNAVTRKYAAEHFPSFEIKYPDHEASWRKSTTYTPEWRETELADDYGFTCVGTTVPDSRFILCFGVWAFGTLAATRCYLSLPRKSDARKYVATYKPVMLVSYVKVDYYSVGKPELCSVLHQR